MTYAVQTWTDYDPSTPVTAARMAHIEQGIAAAHALVPVYVQDTATYDISTNNIETALRNAMAVLSAAGTWLVTIGGQFFAVSGAPLGIVNIRAWTGSGTRWEDFTSLSGALVATTAGYQPFLYQFKLTTLAAGQIDMMAQRASGTGTLRLQNLGLRLDPLT